MSVIEIRPMTPVVNQYIEKIQKEVNKVQGHPSDLYPELFTPQIIQAIITENGGMYSYFYCDALGVGRIRHEIYFRNFLQVYNQRNFVFLDGC